MRVAKLRVAEPTAIQERHHRVWPLGWTHWSPHCVQAVRLSSLQDIAVPAFTCDLRDLRRA
jgi:hypothetical protein